MSPQNSRALAATIKLISEYVVSSERFRSWADRNHSLLDASGNDGDRGALIASFAEALVPDSNSHDCMTLLDRLVDDYDSLFDGK